MDASEFVVKKVPLPGRVINMILTLASTTVLSLFLSKRNGTLEKGRGSCCGHSAESLGHQGLGPPPTRHLVCVVALLQVSRSRG